MSIKEIELLEKILNELKVMNEKLDTIEYNTGDISSVNLKLDWIEDYLKKISETKTK